MVGKSANPSLIPAKVPKIRGQFIFDVRYQGLLINDQLGQFKIIEKVEENNKQPEVKETGNKTLQEKINELNELINKYTKNKYVRDES